MKTYRVNEIFRSLQGEGFHTGTAAVFVRFSGCNLRCAFCDTRHDAFRTMTDDDIAREVNRYPDAPLLVLTGGEPALQVDNNLIGCLKRLTGKIITVETNGTRPLPDGIDWVTLSPKTAATGGDTLPCVVTRCDELKVVYTGQDLALYDDIRANHRFLQPCFVDDPQERQRNIALTVNAVLDNPRWRLSLQTHRILNIP